MPSELEEFIQFSGYVVPVVILLATLLWGLLGLIRRRAPKMGQDLTVLLAYLFCVGTILHEAAHLCFCHLFGVPVVGVRFFFVDRFKVQEVPRRPYTPPPATASQFYRSSTGDWQYRPRDMDVVRIGGCVGIDQCDSPLAAFFVALAPLIINGLLFALLLFYYPFIEQTPYYPLAIYLLIAIPLGLQPSTADFAHIGATFKEHPGRGFLEYLIFFTMIGSLVALSGWLPTWGVLLVAFILFTFLVFVCRHRGGLTEAIPRD